MAAVSTIIYGVAAATAAYGASEQHKAGTSQKHARKRSQMATIEAQDKADVETRQAQVAAKRDKINRAKDVDANRGTFTDPLGIGGQASTIKKALTGN